MKRTVKSRMITLGIALLATAALAGQAAAYCEGTNKISDADSTCLDASWTGVVVSLTNSCSWRITTEVKGGYSLDRNTPSPAGGPIQTFAANPTVASNSSRTQDYSSYGQVTIQEVSCCADEAACSSEAE